MTNSVHNDRRQQLRKVAILVATLDASLADRLLATLPAREAAAVRELADQFEEIDPAELQAVAAEFRQGVSPAPTSPPETQQVQLDGVELDESLLARLESSDDSDFTGYKNSKAGPWKALSEADATTLVQMLSAEQPQTIAVVLSRLETTHAAELIGKLSPSLQSDVLTRLAELDPADEQTLHVVASQLAQWITEQRQRNQRMTAGCELVQTILENTPDTQRIALLTRLGKRNPDLARKLSTHSHPQQFTTRSHPARTTTNQQQARPTLDHSADPLSELEALSDQALQNALRRADRQTVMLALAGASVMLMKRIVRDLPRRQANQFRQQVRSVGPTRLDDIVSAQRELVRCSRQ